MKKNTLISIKKLNFATATMHTAVMAVKKLKPIGKGDLPELKKSFVWKPILLTTNSIVKNS